MIVFCEDCGKKYRVDPAKIKGRAASFKCRICGHPVLVSKPDPSPAKLSANKPAPNKRAGTKPALEPRPDLESSTLTVHDASAATLSTKGAIRPTSNGISVGRGHKPERLGLRARMLMPFFIIPMIFMAGASMFYIWQFEDTTNRLTRESGIIANRMAEEKIGDLSVAVASQCKLYLLSHPELIKENFNKDPGFKALAVQKVGQSGYTALYQLPDSDGVWRIWAHSNSKFIGIDMSSLKQPLGKNFAGFRTIYTGVRGGHQSRGYYTWPDTDAKFRDKFMVCTPIAGTRFVIAATTDRDEIAIASRSMQSNAKKIAHQVRFVNLAVLGSALLLSGLLVGIYGRRLTAKVKFV